MHKRIMLLVLLVAATTSFSAGGNFGLGGVIGKPTGLSFKLKMGQTRAVDGALAFGMWNHRYDKDEDLHLYLHAAHLWLFPGAIPVSSGSLPLYLGAGARMTAVHDFNLGVRGNMGIAYLPAGAPIDIFFEIGLIVDFIGDVGTDMDAGIGLRYFF
ncbi:MAG: hypothetical protein JNL74_19055 [Fibrobacteres bacterium]|nr:hypothetical protein [Fibrobacterota bacterium]